jgi:hypothetical protein
MTKGIYFELGFIKFLPKDDKPSQMLVSEEFTMTISTENVARYACDIVAPIDIMPTKKKFMWSVKRPKFFETDRFAIEAMFGGDFDLAVFRIMHETDMTQEKLDFIKDKKFWNAAGKMVQNPLYAVTSMPEAVLGTDTNMVRGSNKEDRITFFKDGEWYIEHVMNLHHCWIDSLEIGNWDGSKPVSETIQGTAAFFSFSQSVAAYYTNATSGEK